MNDIIHLLSDAVANQIAAGEVVQRPASAVKELLENAIDAGATHIQLIIKDAGRTLIQVIDNGKGMSFNDARLCFERHATSKLTNADDLFAIQTKGFRGEALASIAAIAHVELKTKRPNDEMGTVVSIEGAEIKEHAPTATQAGTSISVKNLFFNVPARRNFLKSDATEYANIEEELFRVAIIHPNIAFTIYHNGKLQQQLTAGNMKQRIVALFGNTFNDKLFPIEQETSFMRISGFLGKLENAKKKKSEQYMFINNRFVRHNSLNFAIETAYSQLIPEGHHPPYFISIQVNPATIDVNISPTKVEVKLQDDRMIFGFLNAAVKKAIGEYSLVPQLDFDYNKELDLDNVSDRAPLKIPTIALDPNYNPFKNGGTKLSGGSSSYSPPRHSTDTTDWNKFLQDVYQTKVETTAPAEPIQMEFEEEKRVEAVTVYAYLCVYKKYLLVKLNEKLVLLHIARAHERIIYDSYLKALRETPIVVQQSLFPETITLSSGQAELLTELRGELLKLGYDIEPMPGNQFAVNGTPNNEEISDLQTLIETLIDDYKSNMLNRQMELAKNLALSMARQRKALMKPLADLTEVNHFLQSLFSCIMPSISPSGQKVFEILEDTALDKLL